jgi:riboflavin synthase
MFTGIVEQTGTVATVDETDTGLHIALIGTGLGRLGLGESLAVNGVCLTAVGLADDRVELDIIPETMDRTTLGSLSPSDVVNLERPMSASGRFDGHIVQGHVDCVGEVTGIERGPDGGVVMAVRVPEAMQRYLVEKGSVTIDGVSLTVAGLTDDGFEVALIPHTLEITNLGLRRTGDQVNLEMDVLAKYVERLLSFHT